MRRGARTIGVVIGAAPPAAVAEGLRAAVGLTLRGARVLVAIDQRGLAGAGADGARAAATLAMFDHPVRVLGREAEAVEALEADVVELWAGAAEAVTAPIVDGPRARLHLLRPGRRIAIATARDAVLHLPADVADADDDEQYDAILDAVLAADTVLVW